MRIAVVGAGGVGGYLAGRLVDADTAEVHLAARGAHLEALQRDGLTVRSVFGDLHVDVPATGDPADIGPVDLVVVAVKSTDTAEVAASIGPLLGDDTAVVTFQNGVDNEAVLGDHVGDGRVLGGAAFIFSTIAAPGVVEHTGGPARFVFGELDGRRSDRAQRFGRVCADAGIDVEVSDDIRSVLWSKFAFICAQAGMTAASRLPLGRLREDPAAWRMFRRIVEEVHAVAAAEGVALPDDLPDRVATAASGLDADSRSSLAYDLEHGKPLELDALNGTVVRLGHDHGIPVPMNEAVYALLSPLKPGDR